jgi:hypothetical protein
MKPLGGYFELELGMGLYSYHSTPYTFKSGRSALHYILRECKPALVYVPYYCCNALLQSFDAAGVPYRPYAINEALEPVELPVLQNDEYFLYINYFDIKGAAVNRLSEMYGGRLIVDCTQAYFTRGNGRSWFFNSCRKFFGVPDGSFLYAPNNTPVAVIEERNESYTLEHLIKRFNGHVREGYAAFQQNEQLCGPEIKGMSGITRQLLSRINYEEVREKRRSNFDCLHQIFKHQNQLAVTPGNANVPMVYPLLVPGNIDRAELYNKDVFIPTFWAEVLTNTATGYDTEKWLAKQLLPLPVDHRYDTDDMKRMAALLQSII